MTSRSPEVALLADDSYKRILSGGVRHYGKHLLLSASGCNDALLDLEHVKVFVKELVCRIDMVAYGPTFAARFGTGIETGISAVQLIETSAITLHTNDRARDLYLDVFSCKDFDPKDVLSVVDERFAPHGMEHEVRLRR